MTEAEPMVAKVGDYRRYWEEMPCYLSVHDREFRIVDGNRRFRADFGDRIGEHCYRVYKGREDVCPACPVEATFVDGVSHGGRRQSLPALGGQQAVRYLQGPVPGNPGRHSTLERLQGLESGRRLLVSHQETERRGCVNDERAHVRPVAPPR